MTWQSIKNVRQFANHIDHVVAHTYKKLALNSTRQEFKEGGYDVDDAWRGRLDYFLSTNREIEEIQFEIMDTVKRGLEILQRNFDSVVLRNRGKLPALC